MDSSKCGMEAQVFLLRVEGEWPCVGDRDILQAYPRVGLR